MTDANTATSDWGQTELSTHAAGPECYVRVNVTKTSKGYSHETTVSLRWANETETTFGGESFLLRSPGVDDDDSTLRSSSEVLGDLLLIADAAARAEIARREAADGGQEA